MAKKQPPAPAPAPKLHKPASGLTEEACYELREALSIASTDLAEQLFNKCMDGGATEQEARRLVCEAFEEEADEYR
jgi:hypothetical protein